METANNHNNMARNDLIGEQTRRLYRAMPVMNLLEPFCAAIVAWLYWDSGIRQLTLISWLVMVGGVAFLRFAASMLYSHLAPDMRSPTLWRGAAIVLSPLGAICFGYAAIAFHPAEHLFSGQLVPPVVFGAITVAMSLVALTAFSFSYAAASIYVIATLGAIAFQISASAALPVLTVTSWLMLGLFLLATLFIHRGTMDALRLQFKNLALIDYLDRARSDAEALNHSLTREIYERKLAKQNLQNAKDRLESMVLERTRALEGTNRELSATSQRLQLALDASNIGLWDWDLKTGETYHSNFDRLLGYGPDRFRNFVRDLEPIVHPEDWQSIKRAMVAHFKGKTSRYHALYRTRHRDGSWRWIEDEGQVVEWNNEGKASRMIGTRRDITVDKEAADQLRLAATVFENASEGIMILDTQFRVLAVNDCFTRVCGFTEEEMQGKTMVEVSLCREENSTLYQEISETVRREGFWQGELTERRANGESYPAWLQLSAVYNEEGSITNYVGMISDQTARKQAEEQVQFLSNFDRLTGLANRTLFRDRLHKSLALARLNRKRVALVCLDLDRFRPINDSLGHEIGDRLLRNAAERLQALDIDSANLARIGGDEFCLIIEDYSDESSVEKLCNEIITSLRKPFNMDNHELILGVSIGISVFPDHGKEAQTLINQSDLAVHQAKRLGGNNFQFYRKDLRAASVEQLALETSLRKAIFKNEFVVYYQPKLDLHTQRMNCAEALVRWQHPTMGLLMPKDFIPLAEESGLISAISEWVLERTCRQSAAWHKQGRDVKVSVNLSAHQLRKGDLIETVDRILELTGLPPRLLELELTESLIMEDLDRNTEILSQLRRRGIGLSLDDFGTGYSSLSYLKRFPVDTLKIDRSFVEEMHVNADDAAITRAIIDMAHSLNMRVVAEGVEEQDQSDILTDMGCDSIQGWLISKAVPEAEFLALIRQYEQRVG